MNSDLIISKKTNGDELIYSLEGSVNTATAPKLENELRHSLNGINKLTFDFSKLEVLTSAGIRVLLAACDVVKDKGGLSIINCNDVIKETLEITALLDVLNVK